MSVISDYSIYYCPNCIHVFDDKYGVTTNEYMIKGGFFNCQACNNNFQIRDYEKITIKQKRKIDEKKIRKIVANMKEDGYSVRKIADTVRLGKTYIGNIFKSINFSKLVKKTGIDNNKHNKILLDDGSIILNNILPRNKKIHIDYFVKSLIELSCSRNLIYYLLNSNYLYLRNTAVQRRYNIDLQKEKESFLKNNIEIDSFLEKRAELLTWSSSISGLSLLRLKNDLNYNNFFNMKKCKLDIKKHEKNLMNGNTISYRKIDEIEKQNDIKYSKDPLYRLSIYDDTVYISATYVLPLLLTYQYTKQHYVGSNIKINNFDLILYLKNYNVYMKTRHLEELYRKYKTDISQIILLNKCVLELESGFEYKFPNGHVVKLDIEGTDRVNLNSKC